MKSFSDGLVMVGEPFLEKDLISCVLVKLDFEYTLIVVQINAKHHISWKELWEILLSYDSRLEQLNTLVNNVSLNQPSVNFSFNNSRNWSNNRPQG